MNLNKIFELMNQYFEFWALIFAQIIIIYFIFKSLRNRFLFLKTLKKNNKFIEFKIYGVHILNHAIIDLHAMNYPLEDSELIKKIDKEIQKIADIGRDIIVLDFNEIKLKSMYDSIQNDLNLLENYNHYKKILNDIKEGCSYIILAILMIKDEEVFDDFIQEINIRSIKIKSIK